jgi:hypothetical protein
MLNVNEMNERFRAAKQFEWIDPGYPTLSIVLPLFRAGDIAWFHLESLTRQKEVDFDWELIIIEEDFENPFGWNNICQYKPKLRLVRCKKIKYFSLDKWIPLSAKWYFLFQETSPNSKIVCASAADTYSPPLRLKKQLKIFADKGYDWYKLDKHVVFDIETQKHALFQVQPGRTDGLCRTFSRDLALTLPLKYKKKHVDSWTYKNLNPQNVFVDESTLWRTAVNVNGLNNLSMHRKDALTKMKHPHYKTCCGDIKNHLPLDVVDKLKKCKEKIKAHKTLITNSDIKLLEKE